MQLVSVTTTNGPFFKKKNHIQTHLVGTCGCRLQVTKKAGDSWGILGSSAKVRWTQQWPELPYLRHCYNFQNEFPFSHLIHREQAANSHRFYDDRFLNHKNKGKEKKGHKLPCPLLRAPGKHLKSPYVGHWLHLITRYSPVFYSFLPQFPCFQVV